MVFSTLNNTMVFKVLLWYKLVGNTYFNLLQDGTCTYSTMMTPGF